MAITNNQSIVKTCKKHGRLTSEQVRPHVSSVNGKTYYDCIVCTRGRARERLKNNRAAINARKRELYVSTAKKLPVGIVKECKFHGYLTIEQVKTPGSAGVRHECLQCRRRRNNEADPLHDNYIARLILESGRAKDKKIKSILTRADLKKVPELLEIKRIAISIRRKLKIEKDLLDIGPKLPATMEHSKVNIRKAIAASALKRKQQTHCKNGHLLNKSRRCTTCSTEVKRKAKGYLPRDIAAKTLVQSACSGCNCIVEVSKLGVRKDQKCQACKKAYMRNYDANRPSSTIRRKLRNEKY